MANNRSASAPPPDRPDLSSKHIGIGVTARMNDQLQQIARREQNGVSAVCRRLLAAALDSAAPGDAR